MVRIETLYEKLLLLNDNIKEIQKLATGDSERNEIGELIEYPQDAEQKFLYDCIMEVLDKLESIVCSIQYLQMPIRADGILHANIRGRYETDGYEWTCGNRIEVLIENAWIRSRVEHNGKDYYIAGYPEIPMEGLHVRVR
ncbi:MAG: DUF5348 domain-containing protein [Brotaphodocola sp.]